MLVVEEVARVLVVEVEEVLVLTVVVGIEVVVGTEVVVRTEVVVCTEVVVEVEVAGASHCGRRPLSRSWHVDISKLIALSDQLAGAAIGVVGSCQLELGSGPAHSLGDRDMQSLKEESN